MKYLILVISILYSGNLYSQTRGNTLSFGFNAGGTKYWGEFTDNQFWLGGDIFLRYNIIPELSLHASVGLSQLRWKTDQAAIDKYPRYFGIDAVEGDFYPNSSDLTRITAKNSNRLINYELMASYNFFSSEEFVPYLFGGVGFLNHEPRAGDTGFEGPLPNNVNGVYEKTLLSVPVGFGFEFYMTDNFTLNGRATYRFTNSDYLYDFSSPEDDGISIENDSYLNFGIGISYYIGDDNDFDDDGLSNDKEKELGTDPENPDTDGDGINDRDEVEKYNTDPLKKDTDDDGIKDGPEINQYDTNPNVKDTDEDGINDGQEINEYNTDPNNPDTDSDGLKDGREINEFNSDPLKADSDGDGLNDGDEVNKYNTNLNNPDTDGDELNDSEEVKTHKTDPIKKDTDGDTLSDYEEVNNTKTSPIKSDSDEDGLNDAQEIKRKTNPTLADTDGDGINDGEEVNNYGTDPLKKDTDSDGLLDGDEINKHGSNPKKTDSDDDGLSDGDEVIKYKTNPNVKDSDEDGLADNLEVNRYETNPKDPDTDADGLSDGKEVNEYSSDPKNTDTDGDGILDGDEVNKYKTNPNNEDTDGDLLTDGVEINETNTNPTKADTDGDGINDKMDDCPLIPGQPSQKEGKNGCPDYPEVGTKTDFPDILFIVDSDEFNYEFPETARNLGKLLEYVNQCENLQVMIEGHASQEGDAEYNRKLSQKRADRVKKWLIEQGVDENKISGTIGYGEDKPKLPEPTGDELKNITDEQLESIRKQNRRITIEVTKTCK